MLTASRTVTAIPTWASGMLNNDSLTTEVFAIQFINSIICITQIIKLHKTIPTREQTKPGWNRWHPALLMSESTISDTLLVSEINEVHACTGWGLQTMGQLSLFCSQTHLVFVPRGRQLTESQKAMLSVA